MSHEVSFLVVGYNTQQFKSFLAIYIRSQTAHSKCKHLSQSRIVILANTALLVKLVRKFCHKILTWDYNIFYNSSELDINLHTFSSMSACSRELHVVVGCVWHVDADDLRCKTTLYQRPTQTQTFSLRLKSKKMTTNNKTRYRLCNQIDKVLQYHGMT